METTDRRTVQEAGFCIRFVRAALSLYGEEHEFEIVIPDGYDESEMTAAFRAQGCDTTYITPKRTVVVVLRDRQAW